MRSLLQVSGFGPFRDIVRHFEDDDYGTIVHHNLGLRITVLGVDDASTAAVGVPPFKDPRPDAPNDKA